MKEYIFSFKNALPKVDDDELLTKKVKTEEEKVDILQEPYYWIHHFFRLKKMKLILNG